MKTRKFWAMASADNAADGKREGVITIDGMIWDAQMWWLLDGETSLLQFRSDLQALGEIDRLLINNNSLGGDLQSGIGIHNMIREHPAPEKICRIQSAAASAATIIAAACTVEMYPGTAQLIHCCADMSWDYMTAEEHAAAAANLEKWDQGMVQIYGMKTGQTPEAILAQMKTNQWMTAEECVKFGLCDRIIGEAPVAVVADAYNKRVFALGGRLMDFTGLPEPTFLKESPAAQVDGVQGKTIAVDVDGVLAAYDAGADYVPGEIGEPMIGAAEFLAKLRAEGHRVLIHTCRETEVVTAWLEANGLEFDEVWSDGGKPLAHVYLDDRALQFTGDYDAAYNAIAGVEPETADGEGDATALAGLTLDQFAAARPDIVAELHARGVTAERARQADLDELTTDNTRDLIAAARRDGTSVADATKEIIAAARASGQGADFLAARRADAAGANALGHEPPPPNDHTEAAETARIVAYAEQNVKAGRV